MRFFDQIAKRGWLSQRCVLCYGCAHSQGFCDACSESMPIIIRPCLRCGLPDAAPICGQCQHHPPQFARAICGLRYQWPVSDLMHRFKDQGDLAAGRSLAECALRAQSLEWSAPLVPVPLHPAKLRERGFNQSERIARHISTVTHAPVLCDIVYRTSAGIAQKSLGRAARLANLSNVFRVERKPPKTVVLVDDVLTTGATLGALARTLKQAGAESVYAWCMARTP